METNIIEKINDINRALNSDPLCGLDVKLIEKLNLGETLYVAINRRVGFTTIFLKYLLYKLLYTNGKSIGVITPNSHIANYYSEEIRKLYGQFLMINNTHRKISKGATIEGFSNSKIKFIHNIDQTRGLNYDDIYILDASNVKIFDYLHLFYYSSLQEKLISVPKPGSEFNQRYLSNSTYTFDYVWYNHERTSKNLRWGKQYGEKYKFHEDKYSPSVRKALLGLGYKPHSDWTDSMGDYYTLMGNKDESTLGIVK